MARSSQPGDGARPRTGVTVADLLGRQPGPTGHHHRQVSETEGLSLSRRRARAARQRWRRVLLGSVTVPVVAGLSMLGMVARQSANHSITRNHSITKNHSITSDVSSVALSVDEWLDAYAPGVVLTDGGFRAQLLHAGWDSGRVRTAASCTPAACPADWLVSTPALRTGLSGNGPLDSAVRYSTVVAVFGSGADRVEIRHPGERSTEQAARELRARTVVGQALARVPRVAADPGVRAVLERGRADPRVLAMLVSLAQRGTVRVLELPAVPGEDAAGQLRRGMLLAIPPAGAAELTRFFAAQSWPYRPLATSTNPAGLLVRYPPLAPPNLLDGFEGP